MDASVPTAARLCRPSGFHRSGRAWVDDEGGVVSDAATIARLSALTIPPAWRDVWAASDPHARVQATGVDARGRTQYRYSAAAIEESSVHKFADLLSFGSSLPALRTHVDWNLQYSQGSDAASRVRRATAAAVRLIDRGLFRVGSPRYARDNHTYGLTTLARRHVQVSSDEAVFEFIGKEHRPWRVVVRDAHVTDVLRSILDDPADADAPLFEVVSDEGRHRIGSSAVNSFIHGATHTAATAKTFRTWGGTAVVAGVVAGASAPFVAPAPRVESTAVIAAAEVLGNTRAVARTSYVHPRAFDAGRAPSVGGAVAGAVGADGSDDVREVIRSDAVVSAISRELSRLSAG